MRPTIVILDDEYWTPFTLTDTQELVDFVGDVDQPEEHMPPNRQPTQGVRAAAERLMDLWNLINRQRNGGPVSSLREVQRFVGMSEHFEFCTRRYNELVREMEEAERESRAVNTEFLDAFRTARDSLVHGMDRFMLRTSRVDFTPPMNAPMTPEDLTAQINRLKNDGSISVTRGGRIGFTHHCVIRTDEGHEYDMGPLLVGMKFYNVDPAIDVRVRPDRGHENPRRTPYLRTTSNYFHPHVSPDGSICPGALRGLYQSAISTLSVRAMIQAVKSFLDSYNSASPYVRLQDFRHLGPRRARNIVFVTNGNTMSFPRDVFMNADADQRWNVMNNVWIRPNAWRSLVIDREGGENSGPSVDVHRMPFVLNAVAEWFVPEISIDVFFDRDDLRIRATIPNEVIHATSETSVNRYLEHQRVADAVRRATGTRFVENDESNEFEPGTEAAADFVAGTF